MIVADVRPDERVQEDGGLGIEWQGTVDICDGPGKGAKYWELDIGPFEIAV